MPAAPPVTSASGACTFTLTQGKDIAKTVLRYSGALANFAKILGTDCFLPWNLQEGADISEAMGSLGAVRSFGKLAFTMSSREQNGSNPFVPQRPMWEFCSLTNHTGTIQCSVGPYLKSGIDIGTWVHFACLFVQGALETKGHAQGHQLQDTAAPYHHLHRCLRAQRLCLSEMEIGHVAGFDIDGRAWCNLQNLLQEGQICDPPVANTVRQDPDPRLRISSIID